MKGSFSCCSSCGDVERVGLCPLCGREGSPLSEITLRAMLKDDLHKEVKGEQFYFCWNPDCRAVYFKGDGTVFYEENLKVPVGIKRKKDPIPVCYCFGIDRRAIWNEIKERGGSTAIDFIVRKMRERGCECEVKNPSGSCCLPEVRRVVEEGMRRHRSSKKKVLFLCTHNSARSQMAEGILKHLYGEHFEAFSAGTEPKGVNPYAEKVMAEIGIDIRGQYSKSLDEFLDVELDYVITLCDSAKESCPYFPRGKAKLHRGFEDPSAVEGDEEEKLMVFRKVRDEIKRFIEEFFGNEIKKIS